MIGRVVFDRERCKGCEICVLVCPRKIIALDQERNEHGYRPAMITDEEKCTGCAICAQMCPDCVIQVFRETGAAAAGRSKEDAKGELHA